MSSAYPSLLALVAAACGALALTAAPARADPAHHTVVAADAVKWGPAPPSLPPGAQAAVLMGHPAQPGPFVLRLKFPAGFKVPPHRHSKDELLTVISGRLGIGAGERADPALEPLPAGSFVHLPAGMAHYAQAAGGEAIVQINGVGPFDVTYVDPDDDPRKP
jgi:quercetin dioxygenase-like cupin family protein